MDQIKKIEETLAAIRKKHGNACTFTIRNYGKLINYQTYIANDCFSSHQDHSNIEEAINRLESFFNVEDLYAYNKVLAQTKLDELLEERQCIEDEIDSLKKRNTFI
jgi:hypothetical protein